MDVALLALDNVARALQLCSTAEPSQQPQCTSKPVSLPIVRNHPFIVYLTFPWWFSYALLIMIGVALLAAHESSERDQRCVYWQHLRGCCSADHAAAPATTTGQQSNA